MRQDSKSLKLSIIKITSVVTVLNKIHIHKLISAEEDKSVKFSERQMAIALFGDARNSCECIINFLQVAIHLIYPLVMVVLNYCWDLQGIINNLSIFRIL